MSEVTPEYLIGELLSMSSNCVVSHNSEYRTAFLGQNKSAVIEIGLELYRIGGYQAMFNAWQKIPIYDRLELSHAWDGVGDWTV
jgi:hypothetical protein